MKCEEKPTEGKFLKSQMHQDPYGVLLEMPVQHSNDFCSENWKFANYAQAVCVCTKVRMSSLSLIDVFDLSQHIWIVWLIA